MLDNFTSTKIWKCYTLHNSLKEQFRWNFGYKGFFLILLIVLIWYALTCQMTPLHCPNARQHGKYVKTHVGATENYKLYWLLTGLLPLAPFRTSNLTSF